MRLLIWTARAAAMFLWLLQATPSFAYSAGGSDFGWYKVDHCDGSQGYIFNQVGEHAAEIEAVLRTMYRNGQRRLRLPIFFSRHPPNDGVLQASSEGLSKTDLDHISSILAMIHHVGFVEVVVSLFPVGDCLPDPNAEFLQEDLYERYFTIVRQIRARLVASNEPYLLDLLNEGLPFPFQKGWIAFDRRLWTDYTRLYGAKDSLGFSMTEDAGRLATVDLIYGKTLPPVLDVHVYQPGKMSAIANSLRTRGRSDWPWIIGETFYDDPALVKDLRSNARDERIDLLYILQWPGQRNSGCSAISTVPLLIPLDAIKP